MHQTHAFLTTYCATLWWGIPRAIVETIFFFFFLALHIISAAVTGNTSVSVHPIEAYLEEEVKQKTYTGIHKTENIVLEFFWPYVFTTAFATSIHWYKPSMMY